MGGGAVRILVVCPDVGGVDAIAEVRRLQVWHDISILNGSVSVEDVYRTCQEKAFDVIHFAAHGGPDGIMLSNGALLASWTTTSRWVVKARPFYCFPAAQPTGDNRQPGAAPGRLAAVRYCEDCRRKA